MTETILDKAEASSASSSTSTSGTKPKLGFLGAGGIGRSRVEAISKDDAGEACATRVANSESFSA